MNYAKAITAAVITALGTLSLALDDDVLTWREGITVAIALLTALGGVWAIPNKVPPSN